MHGRVGAVIAILAFGALTASAQAAGQAATAPLRRVAEGLAVTDGSRFVVISHMSRSDPDGVSSVAVFDEHSRGTRVLPDGCPAIAVGSGFLLAGCIDRPWRVFDLARRTDQAIAPIPWEPPAGNNDRINTVPAIGSRWLTFQQESSPHGNVIQRRYQDWRNGQVRSDPGGRFVADLDATTLVRPLCRPLMRRFDSWTLAFDDYQYERPFGVRKDLRGRLVLDRCGQRRALVLARGRHRSSSPPAS
jgi:hypothetical protein